MPRFRFNSEETHLKATVRILGAVALAVGMMGSFPAAADPPTGTRVERGSGGLSGRHNTLRDVSPRPGINAYFRCVASLDQARADKITLLEYMSAEQREMIGKIGNRSGFSMDRREDCFSGFGGGGVEIRYDPVSAIGGFAEYFATRRFAVEDAGRLGTLTREDWRSPDPTPRNGSEMIGLCTAQAAGPDVYRLLETSPASDEETAAIQKVVPFLGPCLTDGVEVSFDAASLRALLAHSLYKALTGMEALEKARS